MSYDVEHNDKQITVESKLYNNSEVSLCSLPVEIIEIICKNLVCSESAYAFFGYGLNHVLNLRATCVYLNFIVTNTPLNLKFRLPSFAIPSPSQNPGLYSLIEFMACGTSWKISNLTLDALRPDQNRSKQMIRFLGNFGRIIEGSLKSVILNSSPSVAFADDILNCIY